MLWLNMGCANDSNVCLVTNSLVEVHVVAEHGLRRKYQSSDTLKITKYQTRILCFQRLKCMLWLNMGCAKVRAGAQLFLSVVEVHVVAEHEFRSNRSK